MKQISEAGFIGSDGKLRLPMDRVNAFFAQNQGKRVVVRFEVATPGASESQMSYYYNYVLPTIVQAMYEEGTRASADQTDAWLLAQYPMTVQDEDGNAVTEARKLNRDDMIDFLNWLKEYAAENLFVYIEDPKSV